MRAVHVQFNIDECSRRAEELFLQEAGIGDEGAKYERMRRAAFAIREEIAVRVQLKGQYSFYENFRLRGQKLTIFTPRDDSSPDCPSPDCPSPDCPSPDCPNEADVAVTLECTAFEQLEPASIEGVYAYALTAGDFYLEDRPVMDQLYADIWGTAFTDAGREALVDLIREDCRRRDGGEVSEAVVSNADISDSFGPGFYGMSPAEMRKMPLLVDFHKLGLTVNETGVMQPLKSCGGILLKVNGLYKHLNSACETCSGSRKTCRLCNV